MTNEIKRRVEAVLNTYLEWESFESFLERFDLTPLEVFLALYEAGLIDPEEMEELS